MPFLRFYTDICLDCYANVLWCMITTSFCSMTGLCIWRNLTHPHMRKPMENCVRGWNFRLTNFLWRGRVMPRHIDCRADISQKSPKFGLFFSVARRTRPTGLAYAPLGRLNRAQFAGPEFRLRPKSKLRAEPNLIAATPRLTHKPLQAGKADPIPDWRKICSFNSWSSHGDIKVTWTPFDDLSSTSNP